MIKKQRDRIAWHIVMLQINKQEADSSRAVHSYRRKYGRSVLVNRLGTLPRNNVDRLMDPLDMTNSVDWIVKSHNKQTIMYSEELI